MAEIQKPPIEERSFRRSYLIFAGLLAATTLWAAVDETWVRRPWKDYQSEFNRREEEQIREFIAREESTLVAQDAKLASSKPDQTIEAMETRAKELRSGLNSGEFKDLKGKLAEVEDDLLDVEREFQFTKSVYDEVYYEWKEQEYRGEDFSKGKAEWEELGSKMAALQPTIDSVTAVRDGLKHEIDQRQKELTDVENALAERRQNLIALKRRLENVQSRTIEIKQTILRDYEPNEFNQPIMRVDRCMTCHMAIDKAGFEDWPQPYSTHPRRKAIFGTHPVEQFACTPCHDGQGPGLTVETAHGKIHHWDTPMLIGADIDAGCQKCHFNRAQLGQLVTEKQADDRELRHEEVPYHPTKLMRGQEMIRESQCYACHEIAGYENMPKKGPQLNALSAKTNPEWTYDWLKNPTRFRPTTRMPNPLLPDSEAIAITAFLYRLAESSTYEPIVANVPAGNAPRGGQLMAQIGCYGCHATEGMYSSGDPALKMIAEQRTTERWVHGPDLSRIGSKAKPAWIFDWLKNPRHYWFSTRMPSLRLTDLEAADITAFLMTHKDNEHERAKMPAGSDLKSDELAKMGEYWIRTYGCYGCHDIKGFENAGKVSVSLSEFGNKKVEELFFGDAVTEVPNTWEGWTEGKLTFARRYATELVVQRMPNFAFSDAQADTIALALRSWDGRKVTPQYSEPDNKWTEMRQEGRLLAEFYNCAGCHILEGQGGDIRRVIGEPGLSPPNLNTEGRKVQSDWLVEFLSGPTPIRPWLSVRMPTFHFSDEHLNSVIDYFHALEEYDETFHLVDVSQYSDKNIAQGKKLFDDYRCLSCHVLENKNVTPEEAANLAPNVRLAYSRLRPDWVIDWLRDPQVIDPGTRMPSFFYSEGQRLYEDADSQMVALRNYLMTLGAPRP